MTEEIISEERAYGTVSTLTYLNYFKAGANYLILFVILIVFLLAEVSFVYVAQNARFMCVAYIISLSYRLEVLWQTGGFQTGTKTLGIIWFIYEY